MALLVRRLQKCPDPAVRAASASPGSSRLEIGRRRLVHLADFEHRSRRSDSGDRFLRERRRCGTQSRRPVCRRYRRGCRSCRLPRRCTRPSPHADVPGSRRTSVQPCLQHTEDLHVHRLRLDAFEHRVSHAVHAGFYLVFRHDLDLCLAFSREGRKRLDNRREATKLRCATLRPSRARNP